jgi:hypothetical protein
LIKPSKSILVAHRIASTVEDVADLEEVGSLSLKGLQTAGSLPQPASGAVTANRPV